MVAASTARHTDVTTSPTTLRRESRRPARGTAGAVMLTVAVSLCTVTPFVVLSRIVL
ncbi:hypothetical protein ACFQ0M_39280 [Kitasatospora aburaviensis]